MSEAETLDSNRSVEKVSALLFPRNVVIVGATDRPGNWTVRVKRNLERYGFVGRIFPLNPGRDEVWGGVCYRDFASLPEPPDHLVVLIPAKAVPGVLREAAAAGARSATVMTSGFDEAGDDEGRAAAMELRRAIAETGLAVSGPNCLGNLVAAHSFVTMPDDRPQVITRGPVTIIGQSGGLAMAIKRTLSERGIECGCVITSGNEAGLTTADYIRYFTRDADTRAIVSYLEAVHDRENFLSACREAKAAGKPVVVVKLGTSTEGRTAALAHTGALAGSVAAFDAVAGAAGAIRVTTLDDVIEVVEYLLHTRAPAGDGLGAITLSGGLRGLLLDAAARNGLRFPALAPDTQKALEAFMGAGSAVGNPLDGGYALLSSLETYERSLELMLSDPGIDVLLIQEELPRGPGSERKEEYLRKAEEIAARAKKPVAYVSMISYGLSDYSRTLREELPHLPFLQEPDKAMRVIRAIAGSAAAGGASPGGPPASGRDGGSSAVGRLRDLAAGATSPRALSEPDSKAVLAAYGLPVPRERLAGTAAEAVASARDIGFPVVLKAVSAGLPHKTEAGAVMVGLDSADAVARAYDAILANVERASPGLSLDGVLVAEHMEGGLELALGISNDPEVGPVVMFGMGGVALELYGDVAFAAPGLDPDGAARLISRTKAARLLDGYRGQKPYDRTAVEAALVALGRFARDHGDIIEAVDVNPFLACPRGEGAAALDALVIVRPPGARRGGRAGAPRT